MTQLFNENTKLEEKVFELNKQCGIMESNGMPKFILSFNL